jgi:uncharacterized protein with von Willebrand factor type A (vWA) domain
LHSAVHSLNQPFHYLEALPRGLWLPGVINSVGRAQQRLPDLQAWMAALLRGELPPQEAHFGDADAVSALRSSIGTLALPQLSKGNDAMAQQIVRTALWHLDTLIDMPRYLSRADAIARMADAFSAEWALEAHGWEEVLALLHGLGDLANQRWDTMAGRLQSRNWQAAQRISQQLASMPQLAALIEHLGRAQVLEHAPDAASAQPMPSREQHALAATVLYTHLPDAPSEVRGIKRSAVLPRMLASEAVQINHPVLRKLWRARFAEGALLTFEDEAVLPQVVLTDAPRPRMTATHMVSEPKARGPMILCVDTSGSMDGAPEQVAKAVVLAAMRVAFAQKRPCKLIAFGGPDEIIEHDLTYDLQGLDALLQFIGQSFEGGTDIQAPIERAITRIRTQGWHHADVLIASDGEFGMTPAELTALNQAKATLGLRVQGVLIGDRETMGLLDVCDDIFWVRDWRRYGEGAGQAGQGAGFSPVHSKSLTALYFPNALKKPAEEQQKE